MIDRLRRWLHIPCKHPGRYLVRTINRAEPDPRGGWKIIEASLKCSRCGEPVVEGWRA